MSYEFFNECYYSLDPAGSLVAKVNQRAVTSIFGDSQETLRHIEFFGLCVQLKLGLGYRLEEGQVVVHFNGLYT